MTLIINLFYALLFIAMGVALIKYRKNVHDWTGDWYWAEKYLGTGGTYLVLLLFGMFLIFLGTLFPFGGLELLKQ